MQPSIIQHNQLAIYQRGEGLPLLLFPYPHASTMHPMGEDKLPLMLAQLGFQVITFDPPGAFRSSRAMRCDMQEMLDCAVEALAVCRITAPVRVVGHSMGAVCALGFAIEHPELVERLALIGACSGFPAVMRWSTPHNWNPWKDVQWWQCMGLGFRQMLGLGSLAVHKQLDNLVAKASYVDQRYVEQWLIEPGDDRQPAPPRARWLRTVRAVDFRARLGQIKAPTLLCVGRHDPQTPPPCSVELQTGIPGSRLVVFEQSGHSPFMEEPDKFCSEISRFFGIHG